MILASSGVAGLFITLLLRSRAFTPAAQLTLREQISTKRH
jgi:hypothetical protein